MAPSPTMAMGQAHGLPKPQAPKRMVCPLLLFSEAVLLASLSTRRRSAPRKPGHVVGARGLPEMKIETIRELAKLATLSNVQ